MRLGNRHRRVTSLLSTVLILASLLSHVAVFAHTASSNSSYLQYVHVLERCCPFATRFQVGDYTPAPAPQARAAPTWRLALSFQAYKFSFASGRDCYEIGGIVGESQGLRLLAANAEPEREAHARFFCVSNVQPSSGDSLEKFLYYGENEAGAVAIVQVGVLPVAMQRRGWLHAKTPHFQFRPLALHAWLKAEPMSLITKVSVSTRVRIGTRYLPPQCKGGKISGGNYNAGFSKDPLIYLCVESEEALSGRDAVADDAPGKLFVSGLHLQEFAYKVKKPTCSEGMEAVVHNPNADYTAPKTPLKFAGYETTYFVLCLTKNPVVEGSSGHLAAIRFLSSIFVDDQQERPLRIDSRVNDKIDWSEQVTDAQVVNSVFK